MLTSRPIYSPHNVPHSSTARHTHIMSVVLTNYWAALKQALHLSTSRCSSAFKPKSRLHIYLESQNRTKLCQSECSLWWWRPWWEGWPWWGGCSCWLLSSACLWDSWGTKWKRSDLVADTSTHQSVDTDLSFTSLLPFVTCSLRCQWSGWGRWWRRWRAISRGNLSFPLFKGHLIVSQWICSKLEYWHERLDQRFIHNV